MSTSSPGPRRRTSDRPTARPDAELDSISVRLEDLERSVLRSEKSHARDIAAVRPEHRQDALNLVHYLALRRADLRPLQHLLGEYGLSSLGRCEPHVLATIQSTWAALHHQAPRAGASPVDFEEDRGALDRNTDALFGPRPHGRVPRIMVTFPSEAADDYELVRHLVAKGLDVARINGAHDGPDEWERMSRHVRRASEETGRPCRISMDLPGPKLRTGPLQDGPRVVRLRPERDARGVPCSPARAVLGSWPGPPGSGVTLPIDRDWVARRRPGDLVILKDTRHSARSFHVNGVGPDGCVVEAWNTTYVETGTALSCDGDVARVGPLPAVAQFHLLRVGDGLTLTRNLDPAAPWRHGQPAGARIGCTLPVVFDVARSGQRVRFDDGKITGVIESVSTDEVHVRIVDASPGGSKLRSEKGINLPETTLPVPVVTEADLPLLEIASVHADMVALSFVRDEHDVDLLHDFLDRVGAGHLGVIVKIETKGAFARLPGILLRAMRSSLVGVMIARGDLAVEAGYERLAEMQEEMLWICEAAHLPVIWATEVLDQLARTGRPSRAEGTDAAMAQRAECVMLNKGPHVDTAIEVLDDILRRMAGHQRKKSAQLRPLQSWADSW